VLHGCACQLNVGESDNAGAKKDVENPCFMRRTKSKNVYEVRGCVAARNTNGCGRISDIPLYLCKCVIPRLTCMATPVICMAAWTSTTTILGILLHIHLVWLYKRACDGPQNKPGVRDASRQLKTDGAVCAVKGVNCCYKRDKIAIPHYAYFLYTIHPPYKYIYIHTHAHGCKETE
jgi:hypothetical protein